MQEPRHCPPSGQCVWPPVALGCAPPRATVPPADISGRAARPAIAGFVLILNPCAACRRRRGRRRLWPSWRGWPRHRRSRAAQFSTKMAIAAQGSNKKRRGAPWLFEQTCVAAASGRRRRPGADRRSAGVGQSESSRALAAGAARAPMAFRLRRRRSGERFAAAAPLASLKRGCASPPRRPKSDRSAPLS